MIVGKILLPVLCLLAGTYGEHGHPRYKSDNWTFLRNIIRSLKPSDSTELSFALSPLSLEIVMMVLKHGASGDTLEELIDVIGTKRFTPTADHGHGQTRTLLESLKELTGNNDIIFHPANRIYLDKNFQPKPKYLQEVSAWYDLELKPISFTPNQEAAREINNWVARRTNKKIQDLIKPDSLSEDTKMVIVNTLYFSGAWQERFDNGSTTSLPFYTLDEVNQKTKPFMSRVGFVDTYYSNRLKAKILDLPFVGGNVSMTFVLPDERYGVKEIWRRISYFADYLWNLDKTYLKTKYTEIKIPKFKIESRLNAMHLLKQMGIHRIFKPTAAELAGISPEIFVSTIEQKTYVNVNEDGIEAAAAPEAQLHLEPPHNGEPEEFLADHPFIFTIRKKPENECLFLGIYGGE